MMKIFKNKFFSNTFILMLSGMSTKLFGLIIKIIFTRIVGTKTISLYTLVMPTYSLLLTICTLAMPSTIAKLISENDDIKVINSASLIIILLNILVIIIMFIISPFIANNLLKEPNSYYLLIAMSFTLPFASLACILKGYFYGKQKMLPHVISNTIEQLIRLFLVIIIMPILIKKSYVYAACGLILTSLITELASIIIFILCMNKNDKIYLKKIKPDKQNTNNILSISLPTTLSRISGNICFFLEPIILTNMLLKNGYSIEYIVTEYGIYNAYSIATLTIPSFFINAISMALIPEISKLYYTNKFKKTDKRLKQAFLLTFIIGFSFTILIYLFRKKILLLLYNTSQGSTYIKILAPVFILFYFESIFSGYFQAIGKTKNILYVSIFSSLIKILTLIILSNFKIGIYSLVYSEIINILVIIIIYFLMYKKSLTKR